MIPERPHYTALYPFLCLLFQDVSGSFSYEAQITHWIFSEHQYMTNKCPTPIKSIPPSLAVPAPAEAIRYRYGEGAAYVWHATSSYPNFMS